MFGGGEFYGYEIHKSLASENIEIELSRLYRVLNEMLQEDLLNGRWEKSELGPKKRVYTIGEKGKKELNKIFLDSVRTVHMFYGKYLISLIPKINIIHEICAPLVNGLDRKSNIAILSIQYTPLHKLLLRVIHELRPLSKIYFIKPESADIELELDNLTIVNGSYTNTMFRNDFLDLLFVFDLPKEDSLEPALDEWCRVLKRKGNLAILTPTVLLETYEDPLSIGDFIEKYEHETVEQERPVNKQLLQKLLKTSFSDLEERQLVHMTIISASNFQLPLEHAQ